MKRAYTIFCLLGFLFLLLHSCREEILNYNHEISNQRNNGDFFKYPIKNLDDIAGRLGVDYITILNNYNKVTNFVQKMPDQKGMPIWEKMQVYKSETATGLIIPLSFDNKTLSSILFATLDQYNTIVGINNLTNSQLEKYVFDSKNSVKYRESMLYTFMHTDNQTFGNEYFTNIPEDLFVGLKYAENKKRMRMKDFSTSTVTNSTNNKMLFIESCSSGWSCKNHETWANCDKCPACFSTTCTTIMIYIPDEPFPSGSGFPGGDGEGGGGGTPAPMPPKDPCTLIVENGNAFYRINPNCGGGYGDGSSPMWDDPCEKIKTENIKAKNLLNNAVVSAQNTVMTNGISTSTIEKAFTFGKDANSNYQVSNIILGPTSGASVNMPATNPNFTTEGGVHDHSTQTYDVPSPGDIYWFHSVHTTNSNFNYYYTNGANTGATYVYTITNPTDFDDFPTNYPVNTHFDAITQNWNTNESIGLDFNSCYNYFFDILGKPDEEAMELAMAYVIGKYGMGIGISKKDTNGDFKPLFVKEIETKIPVGNPFYPTSYVTVKTYEITTDCNLK